MADSDLVLALDVGTTNVKAAVVDQDGSLLKIAHREMTVEQGDDGRAEHNPDALHSAVVDCLIEASTQYAGRITLLIPATYQMGLIALGDDDKPLTGMMTLLDTRASETHPQLLSLFPGTSLYDKTGCPPTFHYPLAKLFWIKTKRAELFKQTRLFLSSKDYLLRRLAGINVSDIAVSSTNQYMNIFHLDWDKDILSTVGIARDTLLPPASPETVITDNLDSIRKQLKLPSLTGIALGTYDGGAVGIGLGGIEEGTAVMNFGTTAMLRRVSDSPAVSTGGSMSIQSSFLADGKWIPGGAINNAGAVLRWLRDNVFHDSYELLTSEAKSAGNSSGLLFLPYLSGERSVEIGGDSSGSYYGLRTHHTRAHMIRAAFEGVAFSLARVKNSLAKGGYNPKVIRVGSGGSQSPVWMQIVASVLNTPLQTTHAVEPGLLGSAMLGFVALGHYKDLTTASLNMVRPDRVYTPDPSDVTAYAAQYQKFNRLTELMHEMEAEF